MTEPYQPGTRVAKIASEPDDAHQDGALAVVCSHMGPLRETTLLPDGGVLAAGLYGYFVLWDDCPNWLPLYQPVFIAGTRIRPVVA